MLFMMSRLLLDQSYNWSCSLGSMLGWVCCAGGMGHLRWGGMEHLTWRVGGLGTCVLGWGDLPLQ
jgi:hypothetical protein